MIYHAVSMLCYNNLSLTKAALNSLVVQDIGPLEFWICNNGSSDGTHEWLTEFAEFVDDTHRVHLMHNEQNESPVKMSNQLLRMIFAAGHSKVLGVANDVVLPPNMYRLLDQWPRAIVCGTMTGEREFPQVVEAQVVAEHTPAAVALVRRWCWEAVAGRWGEFLDERYWFYASDCDMALRLAACGIRGVQLDVQYWHHGSATWRLAEPIEQKGMLRQADADRAAFRAKWGFEVADPEYGRLASDINFCGEPR